MGFHNNQFLAVEHSDTAHQHLHIVTNRIGFDGRTLSDSNSYKRIAEFCRQTEIKYGLKQVLSPTRFLPKELRQIPRNDSRKQKLKTDIIDALFKAKNYSQFESLVKSKGYRIERGRGITFLDQKGVRIKGSEVGYSLSKIERILSLGQRRITPNQLNKNIPQQSIAKVGCSANLMQKETALKEISQTLFQSEQQPNAIPSELMAKRKKTKKRHRHHL
jgi:hypothetical protein